MIQLILHLIGDYVLQSGWMAQRKTSSTWAALCHATVYSLPFLLIGSPLAVLIIWATHPLIDRFRLARYVVWAKDRLAPSWSRDIEVIWWQPWSNCSKTGYPNTTPEFLAVWLMIACDNTLHLLINWLALAYL